MNINKIMKLEVAMWDGVDMLDRHVGPITELLEDEIEVPQGAIASVKEDIQLLRQHLDALEAELTATT